MKMTDYQVFPIHSLTKNGIVTNQEPLPYGLVLVDVDGSITFKFNGAPDLTISVFAGQSFGLSDSCTSVTSTAIVTMS